MISGRYGNCGKCGTPLVACAPVPGPDGFVYGVLWKRCPRCAAERTAAQAEDEMLTALRQANGVEPGKSR